MKQNKPRQILKKRIMKVESQENQDVQKTQTNQAVQDRFDAVLKSKVETVFAIEKKIDTLETELAKCEEGSRKQELYSEMIKNSQAKLIPLRAYCEFMRIPPDETDMQARADILHSFPKQVKECFKGDFPIVFHGTNNIGTVREILKTGGLLTPEQRGVEMKSFASQIDVTYKDDIHVSCEFAEPGRASFMPYGAIFAFKPQDDEVENVVSTGNSSEVAGGVNGVSFREEPDRLYGIITTPENLERVKGWCNEHGIVDDKVFSHESFISHYAQQTSQQDSQADLQQNNQQDILQDIQQASQ